MNPTEHPIVTMNEAERLTFDVTARSHGSASDRSDSAAPALAETMFNIGYFIQHHPSRSHLLTRITGILPESKVIPDPEPDGKSDAWRAHRACLTAADATLTHTCILQDDVLIQDAFVARVMAAIERHPETLLLAFVPGFPRERRIQMVAKQAGQQFAPFIVGAYVPTVAIVYPRAVVDGLLAWADKSGGDRHRRPLHGADDGIVAHYCRARRIHPLAMVPCAVEHDDNAASIGKPMRRGSHRRAALL